MRVRLVASCSLAGSIALLAGCGPIAAARAARHATLATTSTASAGPATSVPATPAATTPSSPAALLATTAAPVTAAVTAATAGTTAPAAASASEGTLTALISSPVQVTGTIVVPVSCTTGRTYLMRASGSIDGYIVGITVRVAGYTGPGTYDSSTVGLSITGPDGAEGLTGPVTRPVTLLSGGGSYTVDATGFRGTPVAASIGWSCGS